MTPSSMVNNLGLIFPSLRITIESIKIMCTKRLQLEVAPVIKTIKIL